MMTMSDELVYDPHGFASLSYYREFSGVEALESSIDKVNN